MELDSGAATLRTGEIVRAATIAGPDLSWADRLESLLRHKGEPWNWQNSELLRRDCGLSARFYVLVRGSVPFAHVLIADRGGAGLLGHVWTDPADRGAGASSLLMDRALTDFDGRGGRALLLGSEPGSLAWNYYRRRGFEPVEAGSGFMERYRETRRAFNRSWFASGATAIEPLDWPHWPALGVLFLRPDGGSIRAFAAGILGRALGEETILTLLRQSRAHPDEAAAWVLRSAAGSAVLGFASRRIDPRSPDTEVIDLFCPGVDGSAAANLLQAAIAGARRPLSAYCDAHQPEKRALLGAAGFHRAGAPPDWHGPAGAEIWALPRR